MMAIGRPPAPLSILGVLAGTLRLFFAHWKRHFVLSFLCALPLALLFGLGFFDPLLQATRLIADAQSSVADGASRTPSVHLPPGASLRMLSALALTLLVISAYATAWWTSLFDVRRLDRSIRPSLLDAYAATLSRFFVFGLILLGLVTGIFIAGGNLLRPLLSAIGADPLLVLVFVAGEFLFLGLSMRLALALPAAAWGEDVSFSAAWMASRGLTLRLGAVAVILVMVALLVSLMMQSILTPGHALGTGWQAALAVFIASPVSFLVYGLPFSALATVFTELRSKRKL